MKNLARIWGKFSGKTEVPAKKYQMGRNGPRVANIRFHSAGKANFSFHAAGKKARDVGLMGPDMSVNDSLESDSRTLLNQSEHLFRNNIWAKRAAVLFSLNLNRAKTIPTLRPQDRSNQRYVRGLEKFIEWLGDAEIFDFKARENFDSGITVCGKELQRAGAFLIRLRTDPDDREFPLRIEFISVRSLDHTKNQYAVVGDNGKVHGNRIANGIETDSQGRTVAYWLSRDHDYRESFRILASDCKYLSIYDFINQDVGIPHLTQAFIKLYNFEEWQHNLLTKNRKQAADTHIIEQPYEEEDTNDNEEFRRKKTSKWTEEEAHQKFRSALEGIKDLSPEDAAYTMYNMGNRDGFEDAESQSNDYIQPGDTIKGNETVWLTPGWVYKQSGIQHVDNSDYVHTELMGITSCSGMTHASMTGDYKGANFSSLKHSKIDAEALVKQVQIQFLYPKFCDQIYKWYRDYEEFRNGYSDLPRKIVWVSEPSEALHQLEKVKAAKERVRAGFQSWEEACREFGCDPRAIIESARHRQKELEGLMFTSDPNSLDNSGKPILRGGNA